MNKIFTLFSLLLLLLISCDEDNYAEDIILFTELQPPLTVTSVDTVVYLLGPGYYAPSPEDSTATISLDINNDGIDDFSVSCTTMFYWVSASGGSANYNFWISISGISDENQVSKTDHFAKFYSADDVIDNSENWNQEALLMMSGGYVPYYSNFEGNRYLGLKIKQGQNDYYSWLQINKTGYLITVMSHATNQTAHNSIRAGQFE